jgi:predicted MFS family arabinose efflux permease
MPPLVRLFILSFLSWFAINATSLVPAYLTTLGASQTFIGIFNILNVLAVLAAVLLLGRRLVRWHRLRTLRWGYVLLAASSVASWVLATSLPALAILKVTGAAAQVFASTLMMSLLLDLAPADKRAGSLALFSISGMLTNPLSSLAGEAVLRTFGGPALFLLSAGAILIPLAWSFLLVEPHRNDEEDPPAFHEVIRQKGLGSLLVLVFLFGIYFSALTTFLPKHTLTVFGEANLSTFLTPFSAIAVALRLFLGNQLDRRPPRRFLAWSFGAVAVAMGLLLLPASWFWIAAAGLFYGLGHSILYPLLNTLVVNQGTESHKAAYSNAFLVVNLLGAIVMTPVLGVLGDLAGFPFIVVFLGLSALAGVVLVRGRFPKPLRSPEADPPSGRSS